MQDNQWSWAMCKAGLSLGCDEKLKLSDENIFTMPSK